MKEEIKSYDLSFQDDFDQDPFSKKNRKKKKHGSVDEFEYNKDIIESSSESVDVSSGSPKKKLNRKRSSESLDKISSHFGPQGKKDKTGKLVPGLRLDAK